MSVLENEKAKVLAELAAIPAEDLIWIGYSRHSTEEGRVWVGGDETNGGETSLEQVVHAALSLHSVSHSVYEECELAAMIAVTRAADEEEGSQ